MRPSLVRERSYGSVRLFSFDRAAARERVREASRAAKAARDDIEAIILFGSVARGDAVPGSDADVALVIAASSPLAALPPRDRVDAVGSAFEGLGVGVDLVVLTRAELEGGPLWASLQREGEQVA